MAIVEIDNKVQFEEQIKSGAPTVVDFTASWCGPCKSIAPKFESLAKEHPSLSFLKVDIDKNQDLTEEYKINTVPTFLFFVGGVMTTKLGGSNPEMLEREVLKLTI